KTEIQQWKGVTIIFLVCYNRLKVKRKEIWFFRKIKKEKKTMVIIFDLSETTQHLLSGRLHALQEPKRYSVVRMRNTHVIIAYRLSQTSVDLITSKKIHLNILLGCNFFWL
uniref:Uncharacterized protein n=1 Tax=Wuchereria bancrofti TaxID=6293 RepID=A0A1I8ET52_WUCBA